MCLLSFHRKKGAGLERGLGGEEYQLALQRTQVQQTEGLRSGVHTDCVPAKFKPNLFTVSITFLTLLRISMMRTSFSTVVWSNGAPKPSCGPDVILLFPGYISVLGVFEVHSTSLRLPDRPTNNPSVHALIPTHLSSWRPYFRNPHLSSKRGCLSPDRFNVYTWYTVHYCIRVHLLWLWRHSIEEKTIWMCQRQAVS